MHIVGKIRKYKWAERKNTESLRISFRVKIIIWNISLHNVFLYMFISLLCVCVCVWKNGITLNLLLYI